MNMACAMPGRSYVSSATAGLVKREQARLLLRLVSRRPAVVLECGATSIAVEDEIGRDIYVRVSAA
jgi:hypothetical protein